MNTSHYRYKNTLSESFNPNPYTSSSIAAYVNGVRRGASGSTHLSINTILLRLSPADGGIYVDEFDDESF